MSLKLRRRGGVWYARGTVPARQPDGSVTYRRIERTTKLADKARAAEVAADLERQYFDAAYRGSQRGQTFAEAALTYVQTTSNKRFIKPLSDHFGVTPLAQIDQAAMARAAERLYPGRQPSTVNRQLYTPVIAIMALAGIAPEIKRPKGHDAATPLRVPDDSWYDAVLPKCRPALAAMLVFMAMTGRRVGEAMDLAPTDIDIERREATLHKTKTDRPVVVPLPETFIAFLQAVPGWQDRARVFGYGNRSNVYRDLKKACKAAKQPYFTTHPAGRHKFSTRFLQAGYSLKHLQEAGGWASIKMPAERYGHLEQSEVRKTVDSLGQKWGSERPAPEPLKEKTK